MNSLEQTLLAIVSGCGAANCAAIPQESIRYDRVFRDICAGNACGNYGKCYMCPPDVGPIEALMERAQRYPRAVLYETIHPISDSFDLEGMYAGAAQSATGCPAVRRNGRCRRWRRMASMWPKRPRTPTFAIATGRIP